MKKLIARRLVTIPLIYLLIIVGIFVLQFTTGTVFSYNFGNFKVSGSYDTMQDGSDKLVFPLHLAYNGIDICIDEKTPVLVQHGTKQEPVLPVRVMEAQNGVHLIFDGGWLLTFTIQNGTDSSDNQDSSLSISADFPKNYSASIILPYRMPNRAFITTDDGIQRISCDDVQYVFTGKADYAAQKIELPETMPYITYTRYIPFEGIDLAKIASSELASDTIYSRNKTLFAEAALTEFRSSLTGLYTEAGVTAYIAEMARTGNYQNALTSIPAAFSNGSSRTYISNTFLDSLVKTHASLIAKNRTDISKVRQMLTARDAAVLETEHLVTFILNHMTKASFPILTEILTNADIAAFTPVQAAGVLETMVDGYRYYPALNEAANTAAVKACDTLFNALVKTGDGLFISPDGKIVSVMESIKIAQILVSYGAVSQNEEWEAAGKALFNSLCPFMRERANFPVRCTFITGSDGKTRSGVMPEAGTSIPADLLYPYIVESPYYPREVCLADYAPGVCAWTSAPEVSVKTISTTIVEINVSFLNGATHYMVVSGIKPFTRIQLYDMDFRTDPRFESYNSSGYVYDADKRILYLKMRHKQPVETVRLFYEPVEKPAAPVVPPAEQESNTSSEPDTSSDATEMSEALPAAD